MKSLFILTVLLSSFSIHAYEFKTGIYKGVKMGPFYTGKKTCQVEILKVFEGEGLLVKFKNQVEFLQLKSSSDNDNNDYQYDSLNTERIKFTSIQEPKMSIFAYTDGPALRSTNYMYDCVTLKPE